VMACSLLFFAISSNNNGQERWGRPDLHHHFVLQWVWQLVTCKQNAWIPMKLPAIISIQNKYLFYSLWIPNSQKRSLCEALANFVVRSFNVSITVQWRRCPYQSKQRTNQRRRTWASNPKP
jgi:hypothetical protein